jgi:hypothetical protein
MSCLKEERLSCSQSQVRGLELFDMLLNMVIYLANMQNSSLIIDRCKLYYLRTWICQRYGPRPSIRRLFRFNQNLDLPLRVRPPTVEAASCWSPTRRLVDVGYTDPSIPPRLVEDCPIDAQYIALSHCWGTGNTFITERSSLQDRKEGMDWLLLPKTFQDAMIVTR